ncbi:hypothetical protein RCL1_003253 [Eukaryota sp. TZLM3-RCL]
MVTCIYTLFLILSCIFLTFARLPWNVDVEQSIWEWNINNAASGAVNSLNGTLNIFGGGSSFGTLFSTNTGEIRFGMERIAVVSGRIITGSGPLIIESGSHTISPIASSEGLIVLGGEVTLLPSSCDPNALGIKLVINGGTVFVRKPLDLSRNCYVLETLDLISGQLFVQGNLRVQQHTKMTGGLLAVDGMFINENYWLFNSGVLTGVGDVFHTGGLLEWKQGVLMGSGTFTVNGTMHLITNGTKVLDSRKLTIYGVARWIDGYWSFVNGPVIENFGLLSLEKPYLVFDADSVEDPPILKNFDNLTVSTGTPMWFYLFVDNDANAVFSVVNCSTAYMMVSGAYRGEMFVETCSSVIFPGGRTYFSRDFLLYGQGDVIFEGSEIDIFGVFNLTANGSIWANGGIITFRPGAIFPGNAAFIVNGSTLNAKGDHYLLPQLYVYGGIVYIDETFTTTEVFYVEGGNIVMDGNLYIDSGIATLNGGTICGSGELISRGDFTWVSGIMCGYGRTEIFGDLTLTSDSPKIWTERAIKVIGDLYWDGGLIDAQNDGNIWITANSTAHSLSPNSISVDGILRNDGRFIAHSTLNITSYFVSSGTLSVLSNTTRLLAGGEITGNINMSAGANLYFSAGLFLLPSSSHITSTQTSSIDWFPGTTTQFSGTIDSFDESTVNIWGGTIVFRAPTSINNCGDAMMTIYGGSVTFDRTPSLSSIFLCNLHVAGGSVLHRFGCLIDLKETFTITGTSYYNVLGQLISRDGVYNMSAGVVDGSGLIMVSGSAFWTRTEMRGYEGITRFNCSTLVYSDQPKIIDKRTVEFSQSGSWEEGWFSMSSGGTLLITGTFDVSVANGDALVMHDLSTERSFFDVVSLTKLYSNLNISSLFKVSGKVEFFDDSNCFIYGGGILQGTLLNFNGDNSSLRLFDGETTFKANNFIQNSLFVNQLGGVSRLFGTFNSTNNVTLSGGNMYLLPEVSFLTTEFIEVFNGILYSEYDFSDRSIFVRSISIKETGKLILLEDSWLDVTEKLIVDGSFTSVFLDKKTILNSTELYVFGNTVITGENSVINVDSLYFAFGTFSGVQISTICWSQCSFITSDLKRLVVHLLIIKNKAYWIEGDLFLAGNSFLEISSNAEFLDISVQNVSASAVDLRGRILNYGTYNKSGSGTTLFCLEFISTGFFHVSSGIFVMKCGTFDFSGSTTSDLNSLIQFYGDELKLAGSVISAGDWEIIDTEVHLDGAISLIYPGTFNQIGGISYWYSDFNHTGSYYVLTSGIIKVVSDPCAKVEYLSLSGGELILEETLCVLNHLLLNNGKITGSGVLNSYSLTSWNNILLEGLEATLNLYTLTNINSTQLQSISNFNVFIFNNSNLISGDISLLDSTNFIFEHESTSFVSTLDSFISVSEDSNLIIKGTFNSLDNSKLITQSVLIDFADLIVNGYVELQKSLVLNSSIIVENFGECFLTNNDHTVKFSTLLNSGITTFKNSVANIYSSFFNTTTNILVDNSEVYLENFVEIFGHLILDESSTATIISSHFSFIEELSIFGLFINNGNLNSSIIYLDNGGQLTSVETGLVFISDSFHFFHGSLTGLVTTICQDLVFISSENSKLINNHKLILENKGYWTGGDLEVENSGQLVVNSEAVLSVNSTVNHQVFGSSGLLSNNGKLIKFGSFEFTICLDFISTGFLEVEEGSLILDCQSFLIENELLVNTIADLILAGGELQLNAQSNLIGNFLLQSGISHLNSTINVYSDSSFSLLGGSTFLYSNLFIHGLFDINNGIAKVVSDPCAKVEYLSLSGGELILEETLCVLNHLLLNNGKITGSGVSNSYSLTSWNNILLEGLKATLNLYTLTNINSTQLQSISNFNVFVFNNSNIISGDISLLDSTNFIFEDESTSFVSTLDSFISVSEDSNLIIRGTFNSLDNSKLITQSVLIHFADLNVNGYVELQKSLVLNSSIIVENSGEFFFTNNEHTVKFSSLLNSGITAFKNSVANIYSSFFNTTTNILVDNSEVYLKNFVEIFGHLILDESSTATIISSHFSFIEELSVYGLFINNGNLNSSIIYLDNGGQLTSVETGLVFISDSFHFFHGSLTGLVTTICQDLVFISSENSKLINNHKLILENQGYWTGGDLEVENSGQLVVNSEAVLSINSTVNHQVFGSSGLLSNNGKLIKFGSFEFTICLDFISTGFLEVEEGSLILDCQSFLIENELLVNTNADLILAGGELQLNAQSNLIGNFLLQSGISHLNSTINVYSDSSFSLLGGSTFLYSNLFIHGLFDINNGIAKVVSDPCAKVEYLSLSGGELILEETLCVLNHLLLNNGKITGSGVLNSYSLTSWNNILLEGLEATLNLYTLTNINSTQLQSISNFNVFIFNNSNIISGDFSLLDSTNFIFEDESTSFVSTLDSFISVSEDSNLIISGTFNCLDNSKLIAQSVLIDFADLNVNGYVELQKSLVLNSSIIVENFGEFFFTNNEHTVKFSSLSNSGITAFKNSVANIYSSFFNTTTNILVDNSEVYLENFVEIFGHLILDESSTATIISSHFSFIEELSVYGLLINNGKLNSSIIYLDNGGQLTSVETGLVFISDSFHFFHGSLTGLVTTICQDLVFISSENSKLINNHKLILENQGYWTFGDLEVENSGQLVVNSEAVLSVNSTVNHQIFGSSGLLNNNGKLIKFGSFEFTICLDFISTGFLEVEEGSLILDCQSFLIENDLLVNTSADLVLAGGELQLNAQSNLIGNFLLQSGISHLNSTINVYSDSSFSLLGGSTFLYSNLFIHGLFDVTNGIAKVVSDPCAKVEYLSLSGGELILEETLCVLNHLLLNNGKITGSGVLNSYSLTSWNNILLEGLEATLNLYTLTNINSTQLQSISNFNVFIFNNSNIISGDFSLLDSTNFIFEHESTSFVSTLDSFISVSEDSNLIISGTFNSLDNSKLITQSVLIDFADLIVNGYVELQKSLVLNSSIIVENFGEFFLTNNDHTVKFSTLLNSGITTFKNSAANIYSAFFNTTTNILVDNSEVCFENFVEIFGHLILDESSTATIISSHFSFIEELSVYGLFINNGNLNSSIIYLDNGGQLTSVETGLVFISDSFHFFHGSLTGLVTTICQDLVFISSENSKLINNHKLILENKGYWTGGDLEVENSGQLVVNREAVLSINSTVNHQIFGSSGLLNSNGKLIKFGSFEFTICLDFISTGFLQVEEGSLILDCQSFLIENELLVNTNADLILAGGELQLNAQANLIGNFLLQSGISHLNSTISVYSDSSFSLLGGSTFLYSNLFIHGLFDINNGIAKVVSDPCAKVEYLSLSGGELILEETLCVLNHLLLNNGKITGSGVLNSYSLTSWNNILLEGLEATLNLYTLTNINSTQLQSISNFNVFIFNNSNLISGDFSLLDSTNFIFEHESTSFVSTLDSFISVSEDSNLIIRGTFNSLDNSKLIAQSVLIDFADLNVNGYLEFLKSIGHSSLIRVNPSGSLFIPGYHSFTDSVFDFNGSFSPFNTHLTLDSCIVNSINNIYLESSSIILLSNNQLFTCLQLLEGSLLEVTHGNNYLLCLNVFGLFTTFGSISISDLRISNNSILITGSVSVQEVLSFQGEVSVNGHGNLNILKDCVFEPNSIVNIYNRVVHSRDLIVPPNTIMNLFNNANIYSSSSTLIIQGLVTTKGTGQVYIHRSEIFNRLHILTPTIVCTVTLTDGFLEVDDVLYIVCSLVGGNGEIISGPDGNLVFSSDWIVDDNRTVTLSIPLNLTADARLIVLNGTLVASGNFYLESSYPILLNGSNANFLIRDVYSNSLNIPAINITEGHVTSLIDISIGTIHFDFGTFNSTRELVVDRAYFNYDVVFNCEDLCEFNYLYSTNSKHSCKIPMKISNFYLDQSDVIFSSCDVDILHHFSSINSNVATNSLFTLTLSSEINVTETLRFSGFIFPGALILLPDFEFSSAFVYIGINLNLFSSSVHLNSSLFSLSHDSHLTSILCLENSVVEFLNGIILLESQIYNSFNSTFLVLSNSVVNFKSSFISSSIGTWIINSGKLNIQNNFDCFEGIIELYSGFLDIFSSELCLSGCQARIFGGILSLNSSILHNTLLYSGTLMVNQASSLFSFTSNGGSIVLKDELKTFDNVYINFCDIYGTSPLIFSKGFNSSDGVVNFSTDLVVVNSFTSLINNSSFFSSNNATFILNSSLNIMNSTLHSVKMEAQSNLIVSFACFLFDLTTLDQSNILISSDSTLFFSNYCNLYGIINGDELNSNVVFENSLCHIFNNIFSTVLNSINSSLYLQMSSYFSLLSQPFNVLSSNIYVFNDALSSSLLSNVTMSFSNFYSNNLVSTGIFISLNSSIFVQDELNIIERIDLVDSEISTSNIESKVSGNIVNTFGTSTVGPGIFFVNILTEPFSMTILFSNLTLYGKVTNNGHLTYFSDDVANNLKISWLESFDFVFFNQGFIFIDLFDILNGNVEIYNHADLSIHHMFINNSDWISTVDVMINNGTCANSLLFIESSSSITLNYFNVGDNLRVSGFGLIYSNYFYLNTFIDHCCSFHDNIRLEITNSSIVNGCLYLENNSRLITTELSRLELINSQLYSLNPGIFDFYGLVSISSFSSSFISGSIFRNSSTLSITEGSQIVFTNCSTITGKVMMQNSSKLNFTNSEVIINSETIIFDENVSFQDSTISLINSNFTFTSFTSHYSNVSVTSSLGLLHDSVLLSTSLSCHSSDVLFRILTLSKSLLYLDSLSITSASDLSINGSSEFNGVFSVESSFNWFFGDVVLLNNSSLILSITCHSEFIFNDSYLIGSDNSFLINNGVVNRIKGSFFYIYSSFINNGEISFCSGEVVVESVLINNNNLVICSDTLVSSFGIIYSFDSLIIYGDLILFKGTSLFSGFLSINDNATMIIHDGNHEFSNLIASNQFSPIIFDSFDCNFVNQSNFELFSNSSLWPSCSSLLKISDSLIDNIVGYSGFLSINDSNVVIRTLSLHNLFFLHVEFNHILNITDTYTRQSYYYPEGLVTGPGLIIFPTGNATSDLVGSHCIYAYFGRDCSVSCDFFTTCPTCTQWLECGWNSEYFEILTPNIEQGNCIVSTLEGHPLNNISFNFYYLDCSVCDHVSTVSPSLFTIEHAKLITNSLSFTPTNNFYQPLIEFSAVLPYVRSTETTRGLTWVVDVAPFSSSLPFNELNANSCENRDWKQISSDSYMFSPTSPSATMFGALNHPRYPSYLFGNNWSLRTLSCGVIQLSRIFSLTQLTSCLSRPNSSHIKVSIYNESPLFDIAGTFHSSLVSPSTSMHTPSTVLFSNRLAFAVQYSVLPLNSFVSLCNFTDSCSENNIPSVKLDLLDVVFINEEGFINLNITILAISEENYQLNHLESFCSDSAAILRASYNHPLGRSYSFSCNNSFAYPFQVIGSYSFIFSIRDCPPKEQHCFDTGNRLLFTTDFYLQRLNSYDDVLQRGLGLLFLTNSIIRNSAEQVFDSNVFKLGSPGPFQRNQLIYVVPFKLSSSSHNVSLSPYNLFLCQTIPSQFDCSNSTISWPVVSKGKLVNSSLDPMWSSYSPSMGFLDPLKSIGSKVDGTVFGSAIVFTVPVLAKSSVLMVSVDFIDSNNPLDPSLMTDDVMFPDLISISSNIFVVGYTPPRIIIPFPWITVSAVVFISLVLILSAIEYVRRRTYYARLSKKELKRLRSSKSKSLAAFTIKEKIASDPMGLTSREPLSSGLIKPLNKPAIVVPTNLPSLPSLSKKSGVIKGVKKSIESTPEPSFFSTATDSLPGTTELQPTSSSVNRNTPIAQETEGPDSYSVLKLTPITSVKSIELPGVKSLPVSFETNNLPSFSVPLQNNKFPSSLQTVVIPGSSLPSLKKIPEPSSSLPSVTNLPSLKKASLRKAENVVKNEEILNFDRALPPVSHFLNNQKKR